MYKLQRFFDIFWKSLVDRDYYRDLLRASFAFSLKYIFILFFILTVATTLRNTLLYLPKLPGLSQEIESFQQSLATFYPEDLILTIKDGVASTNVKEPYAIDLPPAWVDLLEFENDKHFMVIDTAGSVEEYPSYNSEFLLTKNSLVIPDQSGYRIQPLREVSEDTVLSKQAYDSLINIVQPFLDFIRKSLVFLLVLYVILWPILGAVFGVVGKLFYLLFFNLVILFMARILRLPYTYRELYRLSMHGLTLPILVNFILSVFGIWIPLLFSMLFVGFMTFVLTHLRVASPGTPQITPVPESPTTHGSDNEK